MQELDAKVLNELIDRIVVYEKVTNPDRQKSQWVDLHYKFIGFLPVPVEVLLTPTAPEIRVTITPDGEPISA